MVRLLGAWLDCSSIGHDRTPAGKQTDFTMLAADIDMVFHYEHCAEKTGKDNVVVAVVVVVVVVVVFVVFVVLVVVVAFVVGSSRCCIFVDFRHNGCSRR